MTLIVEDGTGKADAEAYNSHATALAYHTKMGNAGWPSEQAEGEAALRRAALFMKRFRARWAGYRYTLVQALDWPRVAVPQGDGPLVGAAFYDPNVIPADILVAEAEFALRAVTGDLSPDQTRGILKESVGPISTEYDPASPQQPTYPAIEAILNPYFAGGGGSALRILRA